MKNSLLILSILIVLLHPSLSVSIQQTKISISRSTLRTSICQFSNYTFTQQQRQHTSKLISAYTYLTTDKIQAMLYNQDFSSQANQTYILIAPHSVALVILIIMIPGLICCCARPQKYPVCKKCRKEQKQMYSKVQLKWPAFATLFAYLVICTGSAAALAGGPDIINYFNNVGCQLTSVADDTLYGRISPSNDAVFFIGLTPLKSQFTAYSGSKLNTFFSQSNTSLNESQGVRTQQVAVQNQILSQYTSYSDPTYTNAFRQSDGVTYTPITSQWKTMYYGPVSDTTKILGNINSKLQTLFTEINAALDPMIAQWLYLQGESQPTISTYLTNTINKIGTHEAQLTKTIQYYEYFDRAQQFTLYNLGIKLVYGIILALALLGLISTILLTFCTVVRIRLLLYFTCSFLVFMAVITFIMLIFIALFLPNVAQSCAYIDAKLQSQQGTIQLFTKLQYNSSANLYSKCSKTYGNGNMIISLNQQYNQAFHAMNLIASYTLKFNNLIPNFVASKFQAPFTSAYTTINQVKTAVKLDFTSTTALNFLRAISLKTFTKDPVTCTNQPNINADSWVPSRSSISCQVGLPHQPPCLDLSSTVVCPQGCYQMYAQLTDPLGNPTSYSTNLYSRYGSNCNYADYIIDLHQQWTLPKISNLNTVKTNIDNIKTNVDSYQTKVSTIQGSLNSFKSNLQQNFNSFMNPITGSFNGVDCTVIGETIIELRDSFCVGFLGSLEYNFIMLCLISYGILMLSCFTVCAGVRHYQHLQKMQVKVDYKGVPVSVTSNRIIDKFDT